jgi:magnesium chelatase subunit I
LLYVDEVNLLNDEIVDAILDAAAQGTYTVKRGAVAATYRARFNLIGSMNPEEGRLRPQILDRFGLRVVVRGLEDPRRRLEAYQRAMAFRKNPRAFLNAYADLTEQTRLELQGARDQMAEVRISRRTENFALKIIQELKIDSLRAEITLFEAARAHAVADGRKRAAPNDVRAVAAMALRLRRSAFMHDYFQQQAEEEAELDRLLKQQA